MICNMIVLVGAVILAVKNIYHFFKKPVDSIQQHAEEKEEQHIIAVMDSKIPQLLKDYMAPVMEAITEIKTINLQQAKKLDEISQVSDLLVNSQMDLMRYNMNNLYYKYRPYKKILDCDKKAFIKFYNDYHSMGGNTWIDELYKEVITWEIIEDENELKN